MKKVTSLFLMLLLCATMVFLATSCDTEYTIEDFKSKIDAAGSYQISITQFNTPFEEPTRVIKTDGNIWSSSDGNSTEYLEVVGDVAYLYSQRDDGTWSKETADTFLLVNTLLMEKMIDPNAYEKVKDQKNTYQMKSDALVELGFEGSSDVIMTIEKDSCTIKASVDGQLTGSLQFSKIGEIELTLPAVE